MKLTEHFELEEFVASQTATRKGIDNTPPAEAVDYLKSLCEAVLEPLRQQLGPVRISSGYRCPALNFAIGGSANSQHVKGQAADILVPGRPLNEVFNWIYSNSPYDQLIREFPPAGWVHVSYIGEPPRREALIALRVKEHVNYVPISQHLGA